MSWETFDLGFWHPFGPHGGESSQEILQRKRREIELNGWTLWSFQDRSRSFDTWNRELSSTKASSIFVFCSGGDGTVDPYRPGNSTERIACGGYQFIGHDWQPMPSCVKIPHPFSSHRKKLASAFIVQRVHFPIKPFQPPAVEWFSCGDRIWRQEVANSNRTLGLPTRGEYLIRRGGTIPMRAVRAVLELKPPYLATVIANEA